MPRMKEFVLTNCLMCGKEFRKNAKDHKYCQYECRYQSVLMRNRASYKDELQLHPVKGKVYKKRKSGIGRCTIIEKIDEYVTCRTLYGREFKMNWHVFKRNYEAV